MDILEAVDNGVVTIIIFFDFGKAFDIVPHNILLFELKSFELSSSVLKWFASYLSGRSESVIGNNGERSQSNNIETGCTIGF